MAKDIETLKQQALQIKNEVEDGANTADRVGGMFSDMLDYNDEKLTELSSKVIILKSVTSEAITSGNTGVEKVGDYYYYIPNKELRRCTKFTSPTDFKVEILDFADGTIYVIDNYLYKWDGDSFIRADEDVLGKVYLRFNKGGIQIETGETIESSNRLYSTYITDSFLIKLKSDYVIKSVINYSDDDVTYKLVGINQYEADVSFGNKVRLVVARKDDSDITTKEDIIDTFIIKNDAYKKLDSKVVILKSVTSETIASGNTGVEKVGDYYYYIPNKELRRCTQFTSPTDFKVETILPNSDTAYINGDFVYYSFGNELISIESKLTKIEKYTSANIEFKGGALNAETGSIESNASTRVYSVNVNNALYINIPRFISESGKYGGVFLNKENNILDKVIFTDGVKMKNVSVQIIVPDGAETFSCTTYNEDIQPFTYVEIKKLNIQSNSSSDNDTISYLYHTINNKYKNFKGYVLEAEPIPSEYKEGDFYIFKTEKESVSLWGTEIWYNGVLYYDGEKWIGEKIIDDYTRTSPDSDYDICIVGGGAGGIGAAYALKNSGLKVCLLEKCSSLGGAHVNAYVRSWIATPCPPFVDEIYKNNPDIFYNHSMDYYPTTYYVSHDDAINGRGNSISFKRLALSKLYYDELIKTIDIKLNRKFISAKAKNQQCQSIVVKNLLTGGEEEIYAKVFIDCADGWMTSQINGDENEGYYWGSDGRDMYNETFYEEGELADRLAINTPEIAFRIEKSDKGEDLSKVPSIEGVSKAANNLFSELDNPNFQLQTTSVGSGISEYILINEGYDSAYRQGLKNALPCWKATKESNPSKFNSYIYNQPAPMLGLREVVRIKCDKMMTQSDINARVTSADIEQLSTNHFIAMSCWFVDIHQKLALGKTIPTDCRGIAYEMLIPVNLKNVLLGCKCFGASHVASAACRITKTMMSIGNAAGYAAEDFCKNYRDDVRNCDIDYIQKSVDIEGQIQKTELLY